MTAIVTFDPTNSGTRYYGARVLLERHRVGSARK